ncbi:MAG: DUF3253 domain-containing protein, partial [Pseudomonadota bacterium]
MGRPGRPADKICLTCGRPFAWRAKWKRDWAQVKYCSTACKGGAGREGLALEQAILSLLAARADGASCCPSEVARQRYPEERWRDEMETVRQAARRLAHADRIEITQGGKA